MIKNLIPVNNLRHYWSFFGCESEFPIQLGGNCVYLVSLLRAETERKIEMLKVVNGTHVAALIDNRKFFDPCLLMQKSLLVDSDFSVSNLDFDLSGRIELSRRKYNCLNVTWRVDLPNLETSCSFFDFDILNPIDSNLNDFDFELNRPQTDMFFLRFLNLSTGFLNVLCYLHRTNEWFWTFNPYPSSQYRCEVDSEFCDQFYESLGLSFESYKVLCIETTMFMRKFNCFRTLG